METLLWISAFWVGGFITHVSWLTLYFTAAIKIDIFEWIVKKLDTKRAEEFELKVMTQDSLNEFLADKYGKIGYLLGCPQCFGTYVNLICAMLFAVLMTIATPVPWNIALVFFLFAFPSWNHFAVKLEFTENE